MPEIPEPGPARDRMVAEIVGWEWDAEAEWCWDAQATTTRCPSTCDADALAALEAWRAGAVGRKYVIDSPDYGHDDDVYGVTLYGPNDMNGDDGCGPTLPAAATAALLATREGE